MAFTNFSIPKPLQVTVNGFDVSPAVLEINGSYSQFSEGSGLFIVTGELTLVEIPGLAYSLDDRLNNNFSIGNQVITTIDSGKRCPIIGTCYIDSLQYNKAERSLKIGLSCILGLLNDVSPGEIGVCFRIGEQPGSNLVVEQFTTGEALNQIFSRLPNLNFNPGISGLPGRLLEPEWLSRGEGLVSYAGSIAANSGYYLYQDRFGVVQAGNLNDYGDQSVVATVGEVELPVYDRLVQNELPPDKVLIQGELCRQIPPLGDRVTTNLNYGNLGYTFTTNTTKTERKKRIINNITTTLAPKGEVDPIFHEGNTNNILVEKVVERNEYERERIFQGVNIDNCVPEDPGRLIKRDSLVTGWFWGIYASYAQARRTAEEENPNLGVTIFGEGTNFFKSQTIDTWEYSFPDPQEIRDDKPTGVITANQKGLVTHRQTVVEPLGAVFPELGNPFWGDSTRTSELIANPSNPQIVQELVETWVLLEDLQTWEYTAIRKQVLARLNPQLVVSTRQELEADTTPDRLGAVTRLLSLVVASIETDNQTQPGSGGAWSKEVNIRCIPYFLEKNFSVDNFLSKNRTFNLGNRLSNIDEARRIGSTLGQIVWSRSRGQNIGFPVNNLSSYDVQPFSKVVVNELQSISSYALDGSAIVLRANEGGLQADALWLSTALNSNGNILLPISPTPEYIFAHDTLGINNFATLADNESNYLVQGFSHETLIVQNNYNALVTTVVTEFITEDGLDTFITEDGLDTFVEE